MKFPDPTADNGVAIIKFEPTFDRVPSTGELVTTRELGAKYWKEITEITCRLYPKKTA